MRFLMVAWVTLVFTSSSLAMLDRAVARPAKPAKHHRVVVIVRDYRKELVPDAHVGYSIGDTDHQVRTDAHGRVTIDAPNGTHVSASKHDMYASATVKGSTLEIQMAQMPL